jgi:hypothetical protein
MRTGAEDKGELLPAGQRSSRCAARGEVARAKGRRGLLPPLPVRQWPMAAGCRLPAAVSSDSVRASGARWRRHETRDTHWLLLWDGRGSARRLPDLTADATRLVAVQPWLGGGGCDVTRCRHSGGISAHHERRRRSRPSVPSVHIHHHHPCQIAGDDRSRSQDPESRATTDRVRITVCIVLYALHCYGLASLVRGSAFVGCSIYAIKHAYSTMNKMRE